MKVLGCSCVVVKVTISLVNLCHIIVCTVDMLAIASVVPYPICNFHFIIISVFFGSLEGRYQSADG